MPEVFSSRLSEFHEVGNSLCVAHDAGVTSTQCCGCCTGEGSDVDDEIRVFLAGSDQTICQDQTTFSIRVQNFYGLSTMNGEYVIGARCRAGRHVLCQAQPCSDVDVEFELSCGCDDGQG